MSQNIKDVQYNQRTGQIIDPYRLGYDLGEYINLTYQESLKGLSREESINNVIMKRPELLYIAQAMDNFIKLNTDNMSQESLTSRFQNLDYETIRQVYNGRSLSLDKVLSETINGVTRYGFVDETGKLQMYQGDTNPILGHFSTLPTYEYLGPFSKNSGPPTSLIDLFALSHDISYSDKYFDNISDMIFCSRIENNYDRMSPFEVNLGKAIVKYFTTIGFTTSLLVNGPTVVSKNDPRINKNQNDIFSYLMGIDDIGKRERFYQGFRDAQKQGQDTILQQAQVNSNLLDLFDSLIIEEIY